MEFSSNAKFTVRVHLPSVRFPSVRFPSVWFPSIRFPSVWFPMVRFPAVRFTLVWFPLAGPSVRFPWSGSLLSPAIWFPSVSFPSVRFPTVWFPTVQVPAVRFPSVRFPAVQFPSAVCLSICPFFWISPQMTSLYCNLYWFFFAGTVLHLGSNVFLPEYWALTWVRDGDYTITYPCYLITFICQLYPLQYMLRL